MTIQSDEVLKSLIDVREEFGIPLIHIEPVKHFVIYNASGSTETFHLTVCTNVRRAIDNGSIKNFRRTSDTSGEFRLLDGSTKRLKVCPFCLSELNKQGLKGFTKTNFSIAEFFRRINHG